jgi:hypothetical protein
MVLALRWKSRRSITLGRRDLEGLNSHHRLQLRNLCRRMDWLFSILPRLQSNQLARRIILDSIIEQYRQILRIIVVDIPQNPPRAVYAPMHFRSMEGHLISLGIDISERYRFQSIDTLQRFKAAFRFPNDAIKLPHRYKSNAEEIILISLERLSFPHRWSDIYERFPGRKRWFMQACFNWFLDFMIFNWGYLILNNVMWWKNKLMDSCNAIREKMANLNHANWRQQLNAPSRTYVNGQWQVTGCLVALMIDCVMMAFSRPGGVLHEGPASDRVPKEVQEAWWNGWKKIHGMKWQTVLLACGMDFLVYGPLSCRSNDLNALDESRVQDILRELCNHGIGEYLFMMFGDSAYNPSNVMHTSESLPGRGFSSVREIIEWSYKETKQLWKYCDYEHVLKLRNQPVSKIFFVCLLLRNVYVTIHGSQVSTYMSMMPPTLEEWTEQGPQARPLPDNNIWSPNFNGLHEDFDYDSDDSDIDDVNDN